MKEKKTDEIVIYKAKDVKTNIEVNLKNETVWLNLNQMTALFAKDKSVISRHIKNIYREKELERRSTVAKFATVQKEGKREVLRDLEYFNLDVIISVGYRVNSKRGTQFRIWATNVLKQHLIKGYSVNDRRLKELQQTVNIVSKVASGKQLSSDEATGLLKVVADYNYALDLLDKYDLQQLEIKHTTQKELFRIGTDCSTMSMAANASPTTPWWLFAL